jgi:hypothetical protein
MNGVSKLLLTIRFVATPSPINMPLPSPPEFALYVRQP